MKLNSQYYFYMETQTALAIHEEDNCMIVYSSIQYTEETEIHIANVSVYLVTMFMLSLEELALNLVDNFLDHYR